MEQAGVAPRVRAAYALVVLDDDSHLLTLPEADSGMGTSFGDLCICSIPSRGGIEEVESGFGPQLAAPPLIDLSVAGSWDSPSCLVADLGSPPGCDPFDLCEVGGSGRVWGRRGGDVYHEVMR